MEALDDELFSVFDNQSAISSRKDGGNEQEEIQKRPMLVKSAEREHPSEELETFSRKRQKLEDPDLE